jgi:hypothetical protein
MKADLDLYQKAKCKRKKGTCQLLSGHTELRITVKLHWATEYNVPNPAQAHKRMHRSPKGSADSGLSASCGSEASHTQRRRRLPIYSPLGVFFVHNGLSGSPCLLLPLFCFCGFGGDVPGDLIGVHSP